MLFVTGPRAAIGLQHDKDWTVRKEPAMLQTPSLSTRLMACKVLHDSQLTLSHQGEIPGQVSGQFAERGHCGWRTLKNLFSSPVHVAMMHQFLPFVQEFVHMHTHKPFCAQVLLKLAV